MGGNNEWYHRQSRVPSMSGYDAPLPPHIEARIEDTAERAATKALDGFFLRMGVDTKDPISMQKDFAMLRAWRESSEMIKKRGLAVAVTVIVTGALGMIYAALTHKL